MKLSPRFFIYGFLCLVLACILGCTQKSSTLPPELGQNTSDFGAPSSVPRVPDNPKPDGERRDYLTVQVDRLQYADANVLVPLRGKIESHNGVALQKAQWAQVSGPSASILSPTELETLVLMPQVEEPTELVFRLYGVNNQDITNAASTKVWVSPPADVADARVVSASVNEEQGTIDFVVALSKAASVPISVGYRTIDRTAVAPEDYLPVQGILTFDVGQTEQVVSVEVVNDAESDDGEYFEFGINGIMPDEVEGEKPFGATGIGVIIDDERKPSYPTTEPISLGPVDADQVQLEGSAGILRFNLRWDLPQDDLNVIVSTPCGENLLVDSPQVECGGGTGLMDIVGPEFSYENAYWPSYAPPGQYGVYVEHFSGRATDYDVRIFYGEQSERFTGTIANGDLVKVFDFEYEGGFASSSSEPSASSSEPSASSSEPSASSSEPSASSSEPSANSSEPSANSSEPPASSSAPSASSSQPTSSSVASANSSIASASSSELPGSSSLASSNSSEPITSSSESSVFSSLSSSSPPVTSSSESSPAPQSSSLTSSSISSSSISSASSEIASSSSQISSEQGSISSAGNSSSVISSEPASSSAVASSSSISVVYPQVSLELGQTAIVGTQLAISGTLVLEPQVALQASWLVIDLGSTEEMSIPLSSELLTAGDYRGEVDLSAGDVTLSDGQYSVYILVEDVLGRTAQSEPQSFNLQLPTPLNIEITTPLSTSYFEPVAISGSIVPGNTPFEAAVELLVAADGDYVPAADIPLSSESTFSYFVDQPGSYQLLVNAEDETGTYRQEVLFEFIQLNQSASLTSTASLTNSGALDVVDGLPLEVQVRSNIEFIPAAAELQFLLLDDVAQTIDLPISDLWQQETLRLQTRVLMADLDLPFGNYDVHVTLEDQFGGQITSNTLVVEYRPADELTLKFDPGFDGATFINPFVVSGTVTVDAQRTADVSAQLTAAGQTPQAVTLTYDAPQFTVPIDQPGDYELQIIATDGVTTISEAINFSYVVADVALTTEHEHAADEAGTLDLIGDLQVSVGLDSNVAVNVEAFTIEAAPISTLNTPEVWTTDIRFPYSDVWNPEAQRAQLAFPLDSPYGLWAFRVRADTDGLAPVYSDVLFANYRAVQNLTINLSSPADGGRYFEPVSVAGDILWDVLGNLSMNITLDSLDGQGPQNLPFTEQSGVFFASVDQPGRYQMNVTATDGFTQDSVAVIFTYVDPTVSVSVEPQHPVNSDSQYDVTGELLAEVRINGDETLPIESFDLQQSDGEGGWTSVQNYAYPDVWDTEGAFAGLVYDFDAQGQSFGNYQFRVQLNYAQGLSEVSDPFPVAYRQYIDASVEILEPVSDATFYQPVTVVASVTHDPTAQVNVTGVLLASQSEPAESVVLTQDPSGNFVYTVADPGDYQFTVQVDDSNTTDAEDATASAAFNIIDPVFDLQVQHSHPLLENGAVDLFEPLNLTVILQSNTSLAPLSFEFIDQSGGGANLLQSYPAAQVWNGESGTAILNFDFSDRPDGNYPLAVRAVMDGNANLSATSDILTVEKRTLPPLVVSIDTPDSGAVVAGPVRIEGTIIGDDPALSVVMRGALTDLNSTDSAIRYEISRDGDEFFADVVFDSQGDYRFSVAANDALRSASDAIELTYRIDELAIDVSHAHPLVDGALDIIGPLSVTAAISNPQLYPMQQLVMELDFGNNNWQSVASVDLNDVGGDITQSLNADLRQFDLGFGATTVRVRIDYLDGQTSFSNPLSINYRQALAPSFTSVSSPVQGVNYGEILAVVGAYQLDSVVNLQSVQGTLLANGANIFGPQPIAANNGLIDGQIGNSGVLGQADALRIEIFDDFGGTESTEIPIQFVLSADLFVDIENPALDTFSTVEPQVDILASYYPLPGSVDLEVRLVDPAGQVLLVDSVEDSTNWALVSGQLRGLFDFSSVLPLADDNYRVEVVVNYLNGPTLSDGVTLAYAQPSPPTVSIAQPQVQQAPYSFDIEISGAATADDRLGGNALQGVFGRLDRIAPNSGVVIDQFDLRFDGNGFDGVLPADAFDRSGQFQLSVWAEDRLGQTSPIETVVFDYQTPQPLTLIFTTPTIDPTIGLVDVLDPQLQFNGQINLQPGYPLQSFTLDVLQNNQTVVSGIDLTNNAGANGGFGYGFNFTQFNLGEGTYQFRFTAVDSESRSANETLAVRYGSLDQPTITLSDPSPNGNDDRLGGPFSASINVDPRINVNAISLSGQIAAPGGQVSSITIPNPTSIDDNGQAVVNFDVPDNLIEVGSNQLTVTVSDGNGQASTSTGIDFAAPVVIIEQPQNNEVIQGDSLTLVFSVDFTGAEPNTNTLANVNVMNNNQLFIANAQPQRNNQGLWQLTFDVSNLAEGQQGFGLDVGDYRRPNVINDRVADARGRVLVIIPPRQSAPVVTITRPQENETIYNSIGQTTDTFSFLANIRFFNTDAVPQPESLVSDLVLNGIRRITNGDQADILVQLRGEEADGDDRIGTYQYIFPGGGIVEGANNIQLSVNEPSDPSIVSQTATRNFNVIRPAIELSSTATNGNGTGNSPFTGNVTLVLTSNAPITQITMTINGEIYDVPSIPPDNTSPHTYQINLPSNRLTNGNNFIYVDGINGGIPFFPLEAREHAFNYQAPLQPPTVNIVNPPLNSTLYYPENLNFVTIYDQPDGSEPLQPTYEVRVNGQLYSGAFGIPNTSNGQFTVVMQGAENLYRIGSNTISLTVEDYRSDNSLSTTVTRSFNYQRPQLSIDLANGNGSILPLAGGSVRVNYTSNVPLTSAVIRLDGSTLASPTLNSSGSAPFTYSYTIPRNQITPGNSEISVQGWVPTSNGQEALGGSAQETLSYREPTVELTNPMRVSGLIGFRVSDPGGESGGTVVLFYNNEQVGLQRVVSTSLDPNEIFMSFEHSVVPSGNVAILVVYRDTDTGKELFRSTQTVRHGNPPVIIR